jgi:ATP-dependent Clp protease protease subunit
MTNDMVKKVLQMESPDSITKIALLQNRIVILFSPINEDTVRILIEQLFFLSQIGKQDITLLINSDGGAISDGLALYDVMQLVPCDIRTICVGMAASMAAIILAGGTKGKRFVMKHGRIMIHQLSSGQRGKLDDLKNNLKECERVEGICNEILSKATGQPLKKIKKDQQKDYWMGADEAIKYGIVDKTVHKIGKEFRRPRRRPKRKRKRRKR